MEDRDKSKDQLLLELKELRRQLAERESRSIDQNEAMEALRRTEELSREVFERSPLGMVLIGLDLRIIRANPAFRRMLGYTGEEITRLTLADITHPEDLNRNLQEFQRVISGEIETYSMEKRYITKDKGTIWGNLCSSFVRDEEGNVLYGLGLVENITKRKQAEEALKKSEAKHRSLTEDVLDSSEVGTLILDSDFRVAWANRAYESFFGVSREQILGRKNQLILREGMEERLENREQFEKKVLATYRDNSHVENFDFRIVPGEDGSARWLEHWSQPIRSGLYAGGRIEHYYDISDRKSIEEALRDSEEELRSLLENVPDFILTLGLDAKITYLNRAQPGHDVGLVIGSSIYDLGIPEDRAMAKQAFERVVKTGEPEQFEARATGPGGGTFWYANRMNAIKKDGRSVAVTLIATDITKQKLFADQMRDNEDRLKILFEYAPDAYYINDMTGTFLDGNRSAEKVIGYRREEIIGKSFLKLPLLPPSQLPKAAMLLAKSAVGKPTGPDEFTLIRKDGSKVQVEIRTYPVKIKDQRVTLGIARDITERELAQLDRERLRQTEKLASLRCLAKGLGGELSRFLAQGLGNLDAGAKLARRAAKLATRLQLYAGTTPMDPTPQNLSELASEMVRFPYVSIPEGVSIQQTLQSNLPQAQLDPPHVRRMLVELLQNALEAVEGGGIIKVSTGVTQVEDAQYVYVEIEDSGPGMDEETKKRMFDPFFSSKSRDRGLGLASVQGVVRSHKGALRVESRPKQGAKIRVLFPTTESQIDDPESLDTSREDWRGTGTVLVVEGEESVRSVAKSILEATGFAVLLAEDGQTGVRIFRDNADAIRAVLFSATVPFSLGEKAIVDIHRVSPETAIVISSEYAGEELAARLSEPYVSGFLRVPFGPKELIGKLQEVMIGRNTTEGRQR